MQRGLGLACTLALAIAGCKGSEYQTAPVKGKVTFQGQPVTEGQIFFHPIVDKEKHGNNPGKSAFANLDAEGNYQLSTYDAFDGAVMGRHQVMYSPASVESAPKGKSAKTPALEIAPGQVEQTIAAGENVIDFELVPATKH